MKKNRKLIWVIIISLLMMIVGYMRYYPIKHDVLEFQNIIQDKFDVNADQFKGIGLNNKDFYYFVVVGDNIAVVRMKMGVFNRFRYQGMSYTGANFINGVVESNGNKYLLVGGKNPNHEIEKISFTLDNIPYEIDLANPGDTFFEYIQIDNKIKDDQIFSDNTSLYNEKGENITDTIDKSSGEL